MRLCIACCRRVPIPSEIETLATDVDWTRLVRLARFHRTQGLMWRCVSRLGDVPADAAQALSEDATGIAVANLRATAECRSLLNAFNAAGLKLLFLKGQTLGALAYGDPSIKSAIDIDILVDPSDLPAAAKLLRSQEYSLIVPAGSTRDGVLTAWHRRSKESVWVKDWQPIQLDLHTAVSDTPALIPALDVDASSQIVDVGGGIGLPTFATEELFAYLAAHGAWSCWYRLKWIADIAALLDTMREKDIEHLYRRASELGAGRAAKQALLLADGLFGTLADTPALHQQLQNDRAARKLYRRALHFVLSEEGEPTERRLGTIPIHWMHFSLLTGPRAKLAELMRKARWVLFRLTS